MDTEINEKSFRKFRVESPRMTRQFDRYYKYRYTNPSWEFPLSTQLTNKAPLISVSTFDEGVLQALCIRVVSADIMFVSLCTSTWSAKDQQRFLCGHVM